MTEAPDTSLEDAVPTAELGETMHIHRPKPLHGAREILTEIGVIAVGIAIALGGEQVIGAIEWHERIDRAETHMRAEIADDDGPQVIGRLVISPCVVSGLAAVREAVERNASRSAVLERIADVDTPRQTWDSLAYQAASSGGALSRLDAKRHDQWTYFYSAMPALDRADEREFHDGAALHAISRSGGPLTEAERSQVLNAAESLSRDNTDIVGQAKWAAEGMRRLEVVLRREGRDRELGDLRDHQGLAACVERLQVRFR